MILWIAVKEVEQQPNKSCEKAMSIKFLNMSPKVKMLSATILNINNPVPIRKMCFVESIISPIISGRNIAGIERSANKIPIP
jgi:hypothetical protein